ncbi:ORF108 [Agrotis segetum granulovirus]|uniref:Fp n=1 Tax=Agrotis segetum granulosis virus TaxID=10464 RepID=Q6QXG8_GVAS|nr:fp [Agrotis segetum granulovirus]AAS82630.1 ORF108 [Agrotis segetum granulovirus]AHN92158.1 fp [Agrotis segetum granulovirus]AKN63396.1 fp [Agrotis segetum granulovirus]
MQSQHDIDDCVEIYGLGEWDDYNKTLQLITKALDLDIKDVLFCSKKGNGLLVKLIDNRAVNEWERKSREKRLRLIELTGLQEDSDVKVKIFAAAPTKFKLLLHSVRKMLPNFKYIWIGKRGVMARHESRSQIHLIKNENDLLNVKEVY